MGTNDYAYDGDGNLTQDNNKAITSITYNYLNLPQLIHFQSKGNISYVYDASGSKLAKITADSLSHHSTRTLYLDGMVYQQTDTISNPGGATDTLQFISQEEGRVRRAYRTYTSGPPGYAWSYDFFEKDHLGNTRMVLTQERDTTEYIATMEAAHRATESQLFGNIASTNYPWNSMPSAAQNIDSSIRYAYGSVNDSVSIVTGAVGQTTGPNLLLKVMAGDTIMPAVQCYYVSNTASTPNSSFNSVLNSLAGAIVGTHTGAAEGAVSNYTSSSGTVYSSLNSFLTTKDTGRTTNYPKAYLNWILLDDQFNYVSASSGAIPTASTTYPGNQMNTVAPGGAIVMARNGYLYVWVSNETQGWDMYFDNFSVQYKQGPLLEENHYYPFGLTMAGISDKAIKADYAENKYRFNGGNELQNKEFRDGTGLEMYDAGFRMLDPQLGRFTQIDPLADRSQFNSAYSYANDNPILMNDPTGLRVIPPPPVSHVINVIGGPSIGQINQISGINWNNDGDAGPGQFVGWWNNLFNIIAGDDAGGGAGGGGGGGGDGDNSCPLVGPSDGDNGGTNSTANSTGATADSFDGINPDDMNDPDNGRIGAKYATVNGINFEWADNVSYYWRKASDGDNLFYNGAEMDINVDLACTVTPYTSFQWIQDIDLNNATDVNGNDVWYLDGLKSGNNLVNPPF